jgi:hypothetical protein
MVSIAWPHKESGGSHYPYNTGHGALLPEQTQAVLDYEGATARRTP